MTFSFDPSSELAGVDFCQSLLSFVFPLETTSPIALHETQRVRSMHYSELLVVEEDRFLRYRRVAKREKCPLPRYSPCV